MTKAQELANQYGYDSAEEMALEYIHDSSVPAICKNMNCHAVFHMEPDQRNGHCDNCDDDSVESLLSLIGVI